MAKKTAAKRTATKRKRKPGGVNKSQAIRDYLKSKSGAGPTEVCRELKKKGISITPALVSNVKRAMLGKKPGRRRVGRGSGRGGGDTVSMSALIAAKEFAAKVGGVDRAVQILKTLQRLG